MLTTYIPPLLQKDLAENPSPVNINFKRIDGKARVDEKVKKARKVWEVGE